MKRIMFYGLSKERVEEIKTPFINNGYDNLRFLDYTNINHSLGSLFLDKDEIADDKKYPDYAGKEFMMIAGYEGKETGNIIDFFKINNIKRPIACGLTETNSKWAIGELFNELSLEDEYMKEMEKKQRETKLMEEFEQLVKSEDNKQ